MTTMRHPNVADRYEAVDEAQVSLLRMSGWVTEDENPDLFKADTPPDGDDGETGEGSGSEPQDDAPGGKPGEQETKRSRRARPRATSEKEND